MAINFPNAPVNGQNYIYNGVTYTFDDTAGGQGYWRVIQTYDVALPPDASTTQKGVLELNTTAEAKAHVDTTRAMTSENVFDSFTQYGWGVDTAGQNVTSSNFDDVALINGIYTTGSLVTNPEVPYAFSPLLSFGSVGGQMQITGHKDQRNRISFRINRTASAEIGAWQEVYTTKSVVTGSNSNGYYRLYPDGSITQWGLKPYTSRGATSTFTFPVANSLKPTGFAVAIAIGNSGNTEIWTAGEPLSATQFRLTWGYDQFQGISWISQAL